MTRILLICRFLIAATIVVSPQHAFAQQASAAQISKRCSTDGLTVEGGFETSRISSCRFDAQGVLEVTIEPEDAPPINCSPWYHFRIRSTDGLISRTVPVRLRYPACKHRYSPKASTDWQSWQELEDGTDGSFSVLVGPEPVYVAAQETLPVETYAAWTDRLVDLGKTRRSTIGRSVEGRPIHALTIGNPDADRVVLVLGRQHPPEVTGSLGLIAFVETLVSDTLAAASFREKTNVIVVPLVNPDGVAGGHWRHNAGGKDLNRDWDEFSQPETTAVQAYLDGVLAEGAILSLLLDFHSTSRDVLYTLPEGTETTPREFTPLWTERLAQRMPHLSFALEPGYSAGSGVAKNNFHERYGVPGITVEFGDDTDREDIARAGQAAALAMFDVFEKLED